MAVASRWSGGEGAAVGEALSRGARPVRRRAQTLSAERVARLNDAFYLLIVDEMGLAPADAARVLAHRVSRARRNNRVRPARAMAARRGALALLVDEMALARREAERGGA